MTNITGAGPRTNSIATDPSAGRGSILLAIFYSIAAVAGLIGTWYFNLQFEPTPEAPSYLAGWFVNPAAASAAVDVIVVAILACVFYVVEAIRLGRRWLFVAIPLIPLTFAVALAFTFPLFLALREVSRVRSRA